MEWLSHMMTQKGTFLGVTWSAWKVIGWLGNAAFTGRFVVQWLATEKHKKVVIPSLFWWLSLLGSLLLLCYALFYRRDSVFIFAYAFTWIPYIRNLIIHRRQKKSEPVCNECGTRGPSDANYCYACGNPVGLGKANQP